MLDATLPERRVMLLDRIDHETGGWLVKPGSHKVNALDQAWVDRRCVPQPLACFEQKLHLRCSEDKIRRVFIATMEFSPPPYMPLALCLRNDPRWEVETLACGHDAMIDQPEAVAELLLATR